MRQAFRCVFIVMVVDVGGWALCNGFLTIAFALDVSGEQLFCTYIAGVCHHKVTLKSLDMDSS